MNHLYARFLLIGSVARETNLKVKQALPDTAEMHDDIHKFSQFNGQWAGPVVVYSQSGVGVHVLWSMYTLLYI